MRAFDEVVERLGRHFDSVLVRPPAGEKSLAELRGRLPAVPDQLVDFWRRCDGIRATRDDEGELFGIGRSLSSHPLCGEQERLGRLLPLRGDGCGDFDCLVVGAGPCEGAVVFWDHEVYDGAAHLLAGSFLSYLVLWADKLIHEYLPDGRLDPRCKPPELDRWPWLGEPAYRHPWPFDERWLRERDLRANAILGDPTARRWLLRQEPE